MRTTTPRPGSAMVTGHGSAQLRTTVRSRKRRLIVRLYARPSPRIRIRPLFFLQISIHPAPSPLPQISYLLILIITHAAQNDNISRTNPETH